jgi:ferredoxin
LSSPAVVWSLLFGCHRLLFALPFLPTENPGTGRRRRPGQLQRLHPLPGRLPLRRDHHGPPPQPPQLSGGLVDADLCASCGICAGSCPSSTPFRSRRRLVTGIDMPQLPVNALRRRTRSASWPVSSGETRWSSSAATTARASNALAAPDTAVMSLICAGMLPPSFVEYALRSGADGVMVAACRTAAANSAWEMRMDH